VLKLGNAVEVVVPLLEDPPADAVIVVVKMLVPLSPLLVVTSVVMERVLTSVVVDTTVVESEGIGGVSEAERFSYFFVF